MCGIAGILYKSKDISNAHEIEQMLEIQHHRGPDHRDYAAIGDDLYLGSNRLAIIDQDARSNQPMNYRGTTIVFNGAIYNYLELKSELEQLGHTFSTKSDTEVILAAYAEWSFECQNRFNGMWAFAIYDPELEILFCSRDRFGIKPFYYYSDNDRIAFASEIKSFAALSNWQRKSNKDRIVEYLAFGLMDHTSETMFDQIYQLLPGEQLIVNLQDKSHTISRYFSFDYQELNPNDDDAVDLSRAALQQAVHRHLRADTTIGACLSGGLDSSSIVSLVHEGGLQNEFKNFFVGYDQKSINERVYAQAVIEKTGFELHEISPDFQDFESELKTLLYTQDEPFSTTSIFAQNKLFEKIKEEGVKVVLDGQGGDEIFAGYDAFMPIYFKNELIKNPIRAVRSACLFAWRNGFSFAPMIQAWRRKNKKGKGDIPAFVKYKLEKRLPKKEPQSLSEKSIDLLQNMGLRALLHYEDRNSMAHSIESRVPMLDVELVQLMLNLPDRFKIRNGIKKYGLREALKDILPRTIYNRHKKLGFETPHVKWMMKHQKTMMGTIQLSLSNDALVDAKLINESTPLDQLFRVYLYALWREVFVVYN